MKRRNVTFLKIANIINVGHVKIDFFKHRFSTYFKNFLETVLFFSYFKLFFTHHFSFDRLFFGGIYINYICIGIIT